MSGYKNEPIAVVGSSCRFAGPATSPSKLWELLKEPRDVLTKIDRFDADHFYHADGHHHGTTNVVDAYMMAEDPKAFDAQFFNIQAGEAESIDPQQRLLLETIYEGIESAGLTLEGMQGSQTSVYIGVMCEDYAGIAFHDNEAIPKYASTGTARSIQANRISYFFNWCGPSMTIDTACSSSLVAVHQAVQSLRAGESSVAVAAGTNLILGPRNFIAESTLNMLSATGRSYMWDARANGYARGEGIASVILKTLSQAIADGDSIECIIRETGVNQDGRTPGITMPSSTAQAALIKSTYAKAGLDLKKKADRCQYFEAHGTGTKAGDPQEAGAIYNAFFAETGITDPEDILHVGSIKTIIGHTEGTAGIAGLLKASLAIRNGTIPPNMLFETLNPDLEKYWDHLKVPTQALPWPELPEGTPRRASVNSFGFGGTNAHAIIEGYEPANELTVQPRTANQKVAIPFTFSAPSEKALGTQMRALISFLGDNKDIDLARMAWTMSQRSNFTIRTALSALSTESLVEKLEAKLEAKKSNNTPVGVRAAKDSRAILGVFTGQGAQWAAMARELILASSFVEKIVDDLEQSLAELPESDRPTWSLKKEMLAQGKESRISEGLLSQPLCTAVQVILVNLLHVAGVSFESVVGHSSGEIGAAYAAGFLTARDAIRIAYYRGFYAKLAKGANGEKGSMLAAGTSMDDANELCSLPAFEGKMQVAASNSSSSVTLSGDEDAIVEALEILKDEGKFARQLKVDTAYHSHHMEPCSEHYLRSLEECKIQILTPPENAPIWYSSVHGGEPMAEDSEGLTGSYWMKNMLQPVLFSQALTAALDEAGAPAIALEVGPHPALKGPATSTIEEVLGTSVPYGGTLARGGNDVEALADGLGFIWTFLGPAIPSFSAFMDLFGATEKYLLKDLPQYAWDHDRTYWYESRMSRCHRTARPQAMHELLGIRMDDEGEGELRWHNFLKPAEIPWLRGHTIQGQILFPAAGFVALAVEASKTLATADRVALIELQDFSIHNALTFPDEVNGAEIIFSLQSITKSEDLITANFNCDACTNRDTGSLTSMSTGKLVLRLGEPSLTALQSRPMPEYQLRKVNIENQYASFSELGYNYNGLFKAITSLNRTTDLAKGKILVPADEEPLVGAEPFTVHPAVLDVGFQVTLCAIGAPGDSRLWTLHVPTIINKIKINPMVAPAAGGRGSELPANSMLAKQAEDIHGFTGDLSIYDESGEHCFIQCEGVRVEALARPTKASDRHLFGESTWSVAEPDTSLCFKETIETEAERELGVLIERACFFYLKRVYQSITPEEREKCDEHQSAVVNWAEHLVSLTSKGEHPHLKQEWMADTNESLKPLLLEAAKSYEDMHKVIFTGETLLPFVRGEASMLEEFKNHGLLDWFYKASAGIAQYNAALGAVVKQMAQRYPYMNILEIGAGTGSATEAVVKEIGQSYSSYTYTDISAGFFQEAQALFKEHGNGFVYKVLDAEKDVVEQGFAEGGYDCIVASNVLHATKFLDQTLANARRLLKPGGYLILLEITQVDWLRTGFFFAGIPGWWAGAEDGRPYTPLVTESTWDAVFRRTGFSGIDTATPTPKSFMAPYSVMVTQAVDNQINLIRQPLAAAEEKPAIEKLLIVGGQTGTTKSLIEEVKSIVAPFCDAVSVVEKLEDVNENTFSAKHTVLSLTELDQAVFENLTEEKFKALQFMMDQAKNVLWVVQGSQGQNPYSRMMMAVGRCLAGERRDALYMQTIDSDIDELPSAKLLTETLLRLHISEQWKNASYEPLWTLERELYLSKGTLQIERFAPSSTLDNRYNSDRREIKNELPVGSTIVELAKAGSAYQLKEQFEMQLQKEANKSAGLITLKVRRSVLTAIKIKSVGSLYLVSAEVVGTGKKVLAFCESLRSLISVPQTWTVDCDISDKDESSLLFAAAHIFAAVAILGKATSSSSFLVHEASPMLAQTLATAAAEKKVPIAFTSAKSTDAIFQRIHPSTAQALIASYIPKNISVFVDLSGPSTDGIATSIEQELPARCKVRDAATFFSLEGFTQPAASDLAATEPLRQILARSSKEFSSFGEVTSIALKDLADAPTEHGSLQVVDWIATSTVPVSASLVNKQLKFRSDATYWMIGSTGDLGLSTCQWMINRGARFFVLTSRNPKVDPKWLEAMEAKGATIKLMSMDVTNRESMRSVHETICKTLPPIAGVTNAAMVLKDSLLANMDYETFAMTLKPKVDGTKYLDELFPENTLDFFIVYSSLAYVAGNLGQSPYAAANGFMVALAEQRRKRGLAGSVMSFGAISGVGYVERRAADINLSAKMSSLGYAPISEWDYHQFFAEAVLASPCDSGRNFEISNGCKVFDAIKEPNLPYWLDLPKFAYYKEYKANTLAEAGDKRQVSVRVQLKETKSEDDIKKVLTDRFISGLCRMLHMAPEDNIITPESGLVELGIDSLVAVDIRSWFQSEMDLDMPVLKILSGASIENMVEDAFSRLSPDLTPNVKREVVAQEGAKPEGSTSGDSAATVSTEGPVESEGSDVGGS
ncbi:putative polyketide synthase [Tricladium varicosporioides]|nr:putative polyketide synthase [Hymenoscyphus varicosporioides]